MTWILSDIVSLAQYLIFLEKPNHVACDIMRCLHCNLSALWRHGSYPRKADRSSKSEESVNPVLIQRYYCSACKRTCSALPECISPHRWYLWEAQQTALALLLAGRSLRSVEREITPSRHTIGRWIARLKEQWRIHKDVLCNHIADLGRTIDFADFWQSCLGQLSLAQAMRLCHAAGVPVP